jgi:hypothetical protein
VNFHPIRIVCFILLLLSSTAALAQNIPDSLDKESKVIVKMKNGEEYKGLIVDQNTNFIVIRTFNGDFRLNAEYIAKIELDDYDGKFAFRNPNDTRYFFGPSGIPIRKGKGYYQNVLITSNFVNYGITKNFSIGGGFEFISTITGNPIWFLTPKVGFELSRNIHVGGGFIMAGLAAEGTITLGYGVLTFGDSESNLSMGLGYGFTSDRLTPSPAFTISATHRLGNSISLLTENYLFPTSGGDLPLFGIHGIRIMSRKNAFDIGAIVIPEIVDQILALPYVGYVRTF